MRLQRQRAGFAQALISAPTRTGGRLLTTFLVGAVTRLCECRPFSRFYRSLGACAGILLLFLAVSGSMAFAQEPDAEKQHAKEMGMYAMLEAPHEERPGMQLMQRLLPMAEKRAVGRPMLLWYHWANQRKPFGPSLVFLLFFSVTLSSLLPRWMSKSQVECKSHFWKSFLHGALVLAVAITSVRASLLTMIGWPLAIICMGLVQLFVIAGLTVLVLSLGQSIGFHLKVEKWITRPDVRRLFCILIGAVVCAALLQIPGVGILPRIGTRLVMLLAVVGVGGLFRSRHRESETVQ
jgi:hypothetical protein